MLLWGDVSGGGPEVMRVAAFSVWKTQAVRFILSKNICNNIVDHI